MTAYEETLHVNPEKNFEELNNEFAKVKLSEKLAYCVGDPALTVIYTLANTLLVYFLHKCHWIICRDHWYDHAVIQRI